MAKTYSNTGTVSPIDRSAANINERLLLVIDDEPPVRDGMRVVISGWGCEVVAAASMEEAVERSRKLVRQPDLLMAD
jgi:CheY-like chemotaxis protein